GDGAFQVHAGAQHRANGMHVGILDVPAILAQVQRDQVRPGVFGAQRGGHRIGITRVTLLAQRRHVVDIDAQLNHGAFADDTCVTSFQPPPRALYSSTRLFSASRPACTSDSWALKKSTCAVCTCRKLSTPPW